MYMYVCMYACMHVCMYAYIFMYYVTEFAKRGLIHTSNFPNLTNHNFICKQAIKLNVSALLVQ